MILRHAGENVQLLRSARPTPLRRTTRVRLRSSDVARLASERFDQHAEPSSKDLASC